MKRARSLRKSTPRPDASESNALDRDRAASVADEGGTSAANVETQEKPVTRQEKPEPAPPRKPLERS